MQWEKVNYYLNSIQKRAELILGLFIDEDYVKNKRKKARSKIWLSADNIIFYQS